LLFNVKMKFFLFIVLLFLYSACAVQSVAALGMVSKKKSSIIVGPTQTGKLSFNKFKETNLSAGCYTWWDSEDSALNLKNANAINTGWNLVDVSGSWIGEQQSSNYIDNEFPADVLSQMVYTSSLDKNFRLVNLSSTKRYDDN